MSTQLSDDDLYLLHQEEMRLYSRYVRSMAEDGRQPHKTEEHRERWVRFYAKVRPVLTPDVAQRVIQARAGGGRRAKR